MAIHVLRYDDFSEVSSTAVEQGLVEMLLRLRVPCTFAVVPFVCDPESLLAGEVRLVPLSEGKARVLKPLVEAGLAEIALHGYSHLTLAPVRGYQEFSDRMPVETQRKLLRRGRELLEGLFGVKVGLYVPPWNRLAASTAAVLKSEQLVLSADVPETAEPEDSMPAQLPCATGIGGTTGALKMATSRGKDLNVVGTTFHDYDFVEAGHGGKLSLRQFEELLARWKKIRGVRQQLISRTIEKDDGGLGRLRANVSLRQAYNRSRLGRRMWPDNREVFWDEATALGLAKWLRFVP